MAAKQHYCVVLTKQFPDGLEGPLEEWEMSLPDAWFKTRKFVFDGHGTGLSEDGIVSRDLWWFPTGLKSAVELMELMNTHFTHPEMGDVRAKLTIHKGE